MASAGEVGEDGWEMDMSAEFEVGTVALERLSALVDGELDGDAATLACVHWRESVASRASWHAYQLIGDVLRSDDLASDPVHDAGFLAALRARLADEPVVLAPQPLVSSAAPLAAGRQVAGPGQTASGGRGGRGGYEARGRLSGRWMWLAPTAVAAGFVVVAGALMVGRTSDTLPGLQQGVPLASATSVDGRASAAPTLDALAGGSGAGAETFVANGALIRDARLDRYLAAHKQFAGTSALGVPSAFLRSATVSGSDR